MSTTKPHKKKTTGPQKAALKNQTEAGPVIKKVSSLLYRKKQFNKKQKKNSLI